MNLLQEGNILNFNSAYICDIIASPIYITKSQIDILDPDCPSSEDILHGSVYWILLNWT